MFVLKTLSKNRCEHLENFGPRLAQSIALRQLADLFGRIIVAAPCSLSVGSQQNASAVGTGVMTQTFGNDMHGRALVEQPRSVRHPATTKSPSRLLETRRGIHVVCGGTKATIPRRQIAADSWRVEGAEKYPIPPAVRQARWGAVTVGFQRCLLRTRMSQSKGDLRSIGAGG